jgi:hypothetical protein
MVAMNSVVSADNAFAAKEGIERRLGGRKPLICGCFLIFNRVMNILGNLTVLQLRRAIEIKEQIAALENELQRVTEGEAQGTGVIIHPNRRMSAAGRRRIAAVQKARWARLKADRSTTSKPKKFWRMSLAARAAIAEAQRRRWAAIKAAKA